MSIYKLFGIVSFIDSKKLIIGGHHSSIEKLPKGTDLKTPIKDGGKVCININNCIIPLEIEGASVCTWVKIKKYKFKSSYDYNKGEDIHGYNLCLVKIEKNNKWT